MEIYLVGLVSLCFRLVSVFIVHLFLLDCTIMDQCWTEYQQNIPFPPSHYYLITLPKIYLQCYSYTTDENTLKIA